MAGFDNIGILHRSDLMGLVARQSSEPAAAAANDRSSANNPGSFIGEHRMDLMSQDPQSRPRKLRIASILIRLIGVLLIMLIMAGCAAAETPGSAAPLAPSPIIVKTYAFMVPTSPALPVSVEPTALPTPEVQATSLPERASLQEKRLMSIEWPTSIRVGDSDIIRLTLEVDQQGQLTPTVEISGHRIVGREISIPNLYDTDNVFAEARLDMAGLQVSPDGAVRQTMLPGQTLIYYWSISPTQPGTYRGTLWVYLDLVPKTGGEMDQRTLIAHRIDIQSNTVLGLSAVTARWFGAGGAVFSSILGFPFLERILERLWKSLHKEK